MLKKMDHTEYPKKLKEKTYEELIFIRKDAQLTLKADPGNPNAGYYADEINYVSNELYRRNNIKV